MRRSSLSLLSGCLIFSVSVSGASLQARQFSSAPQTASTSSAQADKTGQSEDVLQLPMYTGGSDRNVRVSIVKVVYANNKKEFLPNDSNWSQITVNFENIDKSMVSLDSVKVRQNSGMLFDSASAPTQLARAPDTMGQVGRSAGIMAAGQFAGAFIFPPLALASSVFALVGLGNGQKKWSKRLETIQATALSTGVVPPQSMVSGNVYVPAVSDQKELVFLYSINGRVNQLTVPVSGYQSVEIKNKKKKQ